MTETMDYDQVLLFLEEYQVKCQMSDRSLGFLFDSETSRDAFMVLVLGWESPPIEGLYV